MIRGERGTLFVKTADGASWELPSGKIGVNEEFLKAAKRVAREKCGVGLRHLQLAAMYDVVWHHSDVSVKRLHLVYAAETDDASCSLEAPRSEEVRFFDAIPEGAVKDEIFSFALSDCPSK